MPHRSRQSNHYSATIVTMVAPPPKNQSKPQTVKISLPRDTYTYLTLLAGMGKLASREKDIAVHLIVREVTKMQDTKFHEKTF